MAMTDQLNLTLKQKELKQEPKPSSTQDQPKALVSLAQTMPYSSFQDQYQFTVMCVLILMQMIKLVMLLEAQVFVTL
jgi:hypothetical protein